MYVAIEYTQDEIVERANAQAEILTHVAMLEALAKDPTQVEAVLEGYAQLGNAVREYLQAEQGIETRTRGGYGNVFAGR